MNGRVMVVGAVLWLAACARAVPHPGVDLLREADQEMLAERYAVALSLYDRYLSLQSGNGEGQRVRAVRGVLDALLAARAHLAELQREVSQRQAEIERLEREAVAAQAEIGRAQREITVSRTEVQRLLREATGRDAELARLRRNLAVRETQVDRLRSDLERLKTIDLMEPRR